MRACNFEGISYRNLNRGNSMKTTAFALCAALSLSACATTELTPTPDLFKGPSGWKTVEGTTKMLATDVGEDEVIAEREIELVRTGTLLEDVKSQFGIVKMKAGSPVYAVSYGQSVGSFSLDRLAWCSPAPAKRNLTTLLTGQNDVECLQFVPKGGKAQIMDGGGKSRFFSRSMTTNNSSSIIPIPKIREEAVDFGRRLTLQLRANSLSGKTFEPDVYLHDGEDYTLLGRLPSRQKFDAQDSYLWTVWGGQLKLTRTGSEDTPRLNVEQLQPFKDSTVSVDMLEAAIQVYIAEQDAQKRNKATSPE